MITSELKLLEESIQIIYFEAMLTGAYNVVIFFLVNCEVMTIFIVSNAFCLKHFFLPSILSYVILALSG